MRKYEEEGQPNHFAQGFRLGLIFGVLGALIILGRDQTPQETMLEVPAAEPPKQLGIPAAQGAELKAEEKFEAPAGGSKTTETIKAETLSEASGNQNSETKS